MKLKSLSGPLLLLSAFAVLAVLAGLPLDASAAFAIDPTALLAGGFGLKTVLEQITDLENTRASKAARMQEVMSKSLEEGRSTETAEGEEFDTLKTEVKAIDDDLVRMRELEKMQISRAVPVTPATTSTPADASNIRGGIVTVKSNLPPGVQFARYVKCLAAARGNTQQAVEIAKAQYPDNPLIQTVLKAAVAAGTTTDVTWAAPLVDYQNLTSDFIEFLRPMTILGKFGQGGIPSLSRVPFNVKIPSQTSGGEAYWVGQGAPKPLTKFDFGSFTMLWSKVANIAVLTDELVRFSSPSAEMLVRDALAKAITARMDVDFVDPDKAEVSGISPASITNGIAAIISSGTNAAAVRADIRAVFTAFIAANLTPTNGVWIMSATTALALSQMRNTLGQREFDGITMLGGTFEGLPVIVSQHLAADTNGGFIILVNASDIYLADDGQVVVDASREASLQMLDNPTNNSASGTATTMVSMFQTNSVALRAERYVNWKRRRDAAVAYLAHVAYVP